MPDLWITNPSINVNGSTITEDGAALSIHKGALFLRVWFGWESASIEIPDGDIVTLRNTLNAVLGEA